MPDPVKTAVPDNRTAVAWVPLDVSADDADLTDPAGPTGGNVARELFITTGGDVVFWDLGAPNLPAAERTQTVPDNFYLQCCVKKVVSSGTTAEGITALL